MTLLGLYVYTNVSFDMTRKGQMFIVKPTFPLSLATLRVVGEERLVISINV